MGITAMGCGDDEVGPEGSGTGDSTETSPDGGPLPTSSASSTSSTERSSEPTSRDTNTEPASSLPALSSSSTHDAGESGGTSEFVTSTTEASTTDDSDSTSSVPAGDGHLNGLSASGGLTPEFDVDVFEYDVTLPVFSTQLVLAAALEAGGSLSVDGAPFDAAGHWVSAPLDVGTTKLTLTLKRPGGVEQTYTVNAHRLETTWEYVGVPYDAPSTDGARTALSRDGNTLAISSYWGRSDGDGARVYVRSGEQWTLQAQLEPPRLIPDGNYGWAIELSADGNTLVAGERLANAAYVFERTVNGWELAADLTGTDADGFTAYSFGDSVAISGDGDVIAVGTTRHTASSGAVYVFQKTGETWEQHTRLDPVPAEATPYGGECIYDITLALDASGKTLAIGNGPMIYDCQGSVDVYESTGVDWTKTFVIGEEKLGLFGTDVDLNADGRVLVVADSQDWTAYTKGNQGWVEQAPDPRPTSTYAVHVTDSGNMVVTNEAVFSRAANGWTFQTLLPEPKAVRFPSETGLSISGDGSTVALGSHVYSTRPGSWTALLEAPAGHTNCEERTHDVEGACLYELACDTERVEATCDVREDGAWECACYGAEQGELRAYTVSGGDESTACRRSATLCVAGNDLVGETECTREITPAADECREHETCVTTFDLGDGVHAAVEAVEQTSHCGTSRAGDVYCECGVGAYYEPATETFAIFGAEAAETCELFKGICDGSVTVGQETHCAEPRVDVTDDFEGCTSQRACGVRTPLNETGSIYALGNLFAAEVSCDNFRAADECTCGHFNTYGASLLLVNATRPETSCRVADAVCLGAAGLESGETFECSITHSELEGERCRAVADCGLALAFEGTSVSATESVDVECAPDANGSWACDCTRGWDDRHQFSVQAEAAGGVCEAAVVTCAGRGTPVASTVP